MFGMYMFLVKTVKANFSRRNKPLGKKAYKTELFLIHLPFAAEAIVCARRPEVSISKEKRKTKCKLKT